MSYRIEWSESAVGRLEVLFDFIAQHSRRAATRAIDRLFDRVEILGSQPRLGVTFPGTVNSDLRHALFGKYRVIYRVDSRTRRVRIVAVQHTREARLKPEDVE